MSKTHTFTVLAWTIAAVSTTAFVFSHQLVFGFIHHSPFAASNDKFVAAENEYQKWCHSPMMMLDQDGKYCMRAYSDLKYAPDPEAADEPETASAADLKAEDAAREEAKSKIASKSGNMEEQNRKKP